MPAAQPDSTLNSDMMCPVLQLNVSLLHLPVSEWETDVSVTVTSVNAINDGVGLQSASS